ncbi:MAG: TetR/AcrR family transcriptional regulator [Syntrophales bacterium]|nr:TetR/AcrR family transcriptional regulator [Syntrophales bacterium]
MTERTRRKEKEHQFRRSEILQEAAKVFAQKGFYNTTMAEIAASSGFAIGTLYHFFDSKEALYMALITEKLDLMHTGIREAVGKKSGVVDKIRTMVDAYFRFVEENPDFCTLFIRSDGTGLAEGGVVLREWMVSKYMGQIAFIEQIMETGVREGILKGFDGRFLAFTFSGMVRGAIFEWLMSPRQGPLQPKAELVVDAFLHGVLKGGGR